MIPPPDATPTPDEPAAPGDLIDETGHRPPPGAGAGVVAVVAAFLVGGGAVGASSVMSTAPLRVLLAVAVLAVGWLVARPAEDERHPLTRALGVPVLRGIGTSLVVLGAYLLGLALLTAAVSTSAGDSVPAPAVVVLLVYGVPGLVLLALTIRTRMRAWAAATGVLLPMLVVLLLGAAGLDAGALTIVMLVIAVLLAAPLPRAARDAPWADLGSVAAAMSASFAIGAGSSPFGALGSTQLAGAADQPGGSPGSATTYAIVVAVALVVTAVVLVVAVARRDLATGLIAGSAFAVPSVLASFPLLPLGVPAVSVRVVLIAFPALVALLALVALRVPELRRRLVALRPTDPAPGDAVSAAVCAVLLATAAVVFVLLAMPTFGWDARLHAAVAAVVLAGVSALAYWLPDGPGAAASVVALLGLALATPWRGLLALDGDLVLSGVVELVVAAALAGALVRRHRRVAVYAAATYLLLAALAAAAGGILFESGYVEAHGGLIGQDWTPVTIVVLPLVVLGVPAAVVAFGRHAAVGQAVGAVVLAAGGFVPLKIMVGEFTSGTTGGFPAGYARQASLHALTPTDWNMIGTLALRSVFDAALVAVLVMVVLGLVLAASLGRRPSTPLAASVALALLAAVQSALLTVLAEGSVEEVELLGWALGAIAVVAALGATGVALTAAQRAADPAP